MFQKRSFYGKNIIKSLNKRSYVRLLKTLPHYLHVEI